MLNEYEIWYCSCMRFDILTLFPHMFDSYLGESVLKRALDAKLFSVGIHDIREYTTDKHHKADDTPYGGGAGMVLKVEPIYRLVQSLSKSEIDQCTTTTASNDDFYLPKNIDVTDGISQENTEGGMIGLQKKLGTRIILLSAKGKVFRQSDARRLANYDRVVLICGRYEGVDERVAEYIADEELSLGEYVLTGGELGALVVVDAVARLLPGVLGNATSALTESHSEEGYLEYPQYTKPEIFENWRVPEVLLGGNHAEIEMWRRKNSFRRQSSLESTSKI